ncbi:sulfite exporter TauE/SafE family protein [Pelagibacteraceae bacterium]|nr:sulfite exporter TauE/SafE family protein [Pelagibacteraceae bacterium]
MSIYLPIAELSVNIILLLSIGGVVGFLSGMFGLGGGFLMTPILIFMGIPTNVAVATSANQIVASSISGTIGYWRQGLVDFKMGGVLLIGSFFGSILGVWIFSRLVVLGQIDTVISILYFALLTSIGLIMLIESSQVIRDRVRRKTVKRKIHYHNWAHKLPFKMKFYKSKLYISAIPPIIIGFVIGILSATMGIGGTFILIPAMIYFLGMPTSKVIGTSLFQIIFVTALVTLLHATTTYAVDAVLAFFLIIASVIGAQLGVLAANKLRGEEIRALLAIIVLGVATKIALDLLVEPNEIFNISVIRALF